MKIKSCSKRRKAPGREAKASEAPGLAHQRLQSRPEDIFLAAERRKDVIEVEGGPDLRRAITTYTEDTEDRSHRNVTAEHNKNDDQHSDECSKQKQRRRRRVRETATI